MRPLQFCYHRPAIQNLPTFTDKFHVALIAVYVAVSGLYWVPALSYTVIPQIKGAIYATIVGIGLLRGPMLGFEQLRILRALGWCILAVFVVNLVSTDLETGISQTQEFILPSLWLIALCGVNPRGYGLLFASLTVTLALFFLTSLYPVAAYIGLLPNLYAPESLLDPMSLKTEIMQRVTEEGSVIGGGFAGSSTGWAAVVAPAALLAASLFLRKRPASKLALSAAAVILVGSVASIVVTGARGGSMAMVASAAFMVSTANGALSKLPLIIGVVLLTFSMDLVALPENYLRGFDSGGDLFARVNEASTGRLESDIGGLEQFYSSPIVGMGPEGAKVWLESGAEVSPHNTWIRFLAESGLVLIVPVFLVTLCLFSLVFSEAKSGDESSAQIKLAWPDTRPVILCGLILALVEPRIIFGTFNACAPFWTAVWTELERRYSQASLAA